jgi:prevent-host-death family protein
MDDHTVWARTASIREARANLSEIASSAEQGSPTIITRNGKQVAAVVSVEELQLIEDAVDARLAAEAEESLDEMEQSGESPVGMAQLLAELFDEQLPVPGPGRGRGDGPAQGAA